MKRETRIILEEARIKLRRVLKDLAANRPQYAIQFKRDGKWVQANRHVLVVTPAEGAEVCDDN